MKRHQVFGFQDALQYRGGDAAVAFKLATAVAKAKPSLDSLVAEQVRVSVRSVASGGVAHPSLDDLTDEEIRQMAVKGYPAEIKKRGRVVGSVAVEDAKAAAEAYLRICRPKDVR